MSRKSVGITLLAIGSLSMMGGITSIGWGISKMVSSFQTIATFEAPGSTLFEVTEPGTVTLWHDFETIHNGTTVNHPSSLPGGFTFELIDPVRGPQSLSYHSSATMSSGSVQRMAVGSFQTPEAQSYEIRIDGPEPRIFSVTEGGTMAGVGGFLGGMGIGMVCGFVGLGLVIAGVVILITSKRPSPPEQPQRGDG
ncbi:hypothetical protein [Haloferula sp. A504]|uniref:hypothetical protein n=1 Tax=Haloferula sp. A504 TaxID=3373601 RepID=UPI0031BFCFF3|nr:hypothetical protein [Verrucomicrobiaceae bacterium E54]